MGRVSIQTSRSSHTGYMGHHVQSLGSLKAAQISFGFLESSEMSQNCVLAFVREGDTVVCHSIDRLSRNLDHLRKLVYGLTERGIRVEF